MARYFFKQRKNHIVLTPKDEEFVGKLIQFCDEQRYFPSSDILQLACEVMNEKFISMCDELSLEEIKEIRDEGIFDLSSEEIDKLLMLAEEA